MNLKVKNATIKLYQLRNITKKNRGLKIMSTMINLQKAAECINEAYDVFILTHRSPDGDTLGSASCLYNIFKNQGKRAKIICSDAIPVKYNFLFKNYVYEDFEPKYIITVDIADLQLIGLLSEQYGKDVFLSIDHHPSNTFFAKYNLLDETSPATAQIMFNLVNELEMPLSKEIATCIYTGIVTDTGCFRYSNTNPQSHFIAAKAIEAGVDTNYINRLFFMTKTKARMELEAIALETLEFYYDNRCAMINITRKMIDDTMVRDSDLEGLISLVSQIEGVEVAVTITQKDKDTHKISLRTATYLNASQICKALGGGGHARAAGCSVNGGLEDAKNRILREIGNHLK
jgi:bifunctional oligoribonuclease and PAP phosphatase NrnA